MDPGVPPGSQLEQLVRELELIDASNTASRPVRLDDWP